MAITFTPTIYLNPQEEISSQLRQEFEHIEVLMHRQLLPVQHFINAQAGRIALAIIEHKSQISFLLPERVICDPSALDAAVIEIPKRRREQRVGNIKDFLTHADLLPALIEHLSELEKSGVEPVAISASLIRRATARHFAHSILPRGVPVTYRCIDYEAIPSMPACESAPKEPLQDLEVSENRLFYLPQWLAYDENGTPLVNNKEETRDRINTMQSYMSTLYMAMAIDPYITFDSLFQEKHYGMLGQLVNQARSFAREETLRIIQMIRQRALANNLNRGLSLSLPYFDDQFLLMKTRNFEVVPLSRIVFEPMFVVEAARAEKQIVAQDTSLSYTTRKYLLAELDLLEKAFEFNGRYIPVGMLFERKFQGEFIPNESHRKATG